MAKPYREKGALQHPGPDPQEATGNLPQVGSERPTLSRSPASLLCEDDAYPFRPISRWKWKTGTGKTYALPAHPS